MTYYKLITGYPGQEENVGKIYGLYGFGIAEYTDNGTFVKINLKIEGSHLRNEKFFLPSLGITKDGFIVFVGDNLYNENGILLNGLMKLDSSSQYYKNKPIKILGYGVHQKHVVELIKTDNAPIIFNTKKQAESVIAFAELSQIVKNINEDWFADWSDDNNYKYSITRVGNQLIVEPFVAIFKPLVFETRIQAEKCLAKHEELWKKYYEL